MRPPVASFPARRYNPRLPLASQLNIGGPLLSRFDIVILLLDQVGCWRGGGRLLLGSAGGWALGRSLGTQPAACTPSFGAPSAQNKCLQMSHEWDATVADHILHTHHRRGGTAPHAQQQRPGRQQPAEAAEPESQVCGPA